MSKQRKIFDLSVKGHMAILHKRCGWTYKEIAKYYNCSTGTIRRYITKYKGA